MKKAILIAGGSSFSRELIDPYLEDSFVICIDRGCQYSLCKGIDIDLAIGDFDSIDKVYLDEIKRSRVERLTYNVDKDMTDLELALDYCKNNSYELVYIFSASGTRLDHTMANINFLAKYYNDFREIKIIDKNNVIFPLEGKKIVEKQEGYSLSIIKATGDPLLSLRGVKWPLNRHEIKLGDSLTISNEIVEKNAEIEVANGLCYIFLSRD